jgi:beta-phosphoglucomutase
LALRAVLFDFDGVIVDSEPLHYGALRDALAAEGIGIDEQAYRTCYLAYDDRGAIRLALERHGVPWDAARLTAIAERKAAHFERLLPGVAFFPGSRELVRALAAELPLGIASGALRTEIEAILDAGGLRGAFTGIVGAEDVRRGKPDPEPYLTAMARLAVPGWRPDDCLAFEDSVPGILSARAAGMTVVAATHTYAAAKLSAARRVVDSLAGLTPGMLRELL